MNISKQSFFIFTVMENVALGTLDSARLVLLTVANNVLVLFDAASGLSEVTFLSSMEWQNSSAPDIMSEMPQFEQHLANTVANQSDYLRQISLFEAMMDNKLFNGFGIVLVTEVLQRVYYYFSKFLCL